MARLQGCTLRAAHVAVLAGGVVSLLVGVANGQTRQWNAATGLWYDAAKWSPNGTPTPTDVVWVNNGGVVTIDNHLYPTVLDLVVAANANGGLATRFGWIDVTRDMTVGRDAGTTGVAEFGIAGGTSAVQVRQDLTVGKAGTGTFRKMGGFSMDVGRFLTIGKENGSNGYFQQDNAGHVVEVLGNITIGDQAGSTGRYDLDNGTLRSDRTFVGRDTGSN